MTISVLKILLVLNVLWAIDLGIHVKVVGTGEVLALLFVSVLLNWIVSREGGTYRILQQQVSWGYLLPLLVLLSIYTYMR